jgi:hypothetical protein
MIIFFAWVIWIWILIVILSDVFRRDDISGWAKAAWVVFLIITPFLGVLIYLIAQHDGMTKRRAQDVAASQAQFDDYVKTVAASSGPAGEIEKAKALLDSGAIDQAEYDSLKQKALAKA